MDSRRRTEELELNPEQQKAWESLTIALKKCEKTNICFYSVLDSLHALNGNNVRRVHDDPKIGGVNLNFELLPSITIKGFGSWADDTHFVELKD